MIIHKKRQILKNSCDLVCKAIDLYIEKKNNDIVSALKDAGYVDADYTVNQSNKLEDKLTKLLKNHTDDFLELIEEHPNSSLDDILGMIPNFTKNSDFINEVTTAFKDSLSTSIPHIANSYIKSIDKELKLVNMTKRTTKFISDWSAELADLMRISNGKQLTSYLNKGLSEGMGIEEVSRLIKEKSVLDSSTRARTTALTEMLRANSTASYEAYIQSPAVESKTWRHSGGGALYKPRENHIDMDGQTVLKNATFTLVGTDGLVYYPYYPKDPSLPAAESTNCHCIIQPGVNEAVLGYTLEERRQMQQELIDTADLFY